MKEEIEREKYLKLKNSLDLINNKISEFEKENDKLVNILKNNFTINDNIAEIETIDCINKVFNDSKNKLCEVTAIINNKI